MRVFKTGKNGSDGSGKNGSDGFYLFPTKTGRNGSDSSCLFVFFKMSKKIKRRRWPQESHRSQESLEMLA
jgi:hypothetical protein